MTKADKLDDFIDKVSRLFLEMYGATEEERPYTRFIVHLRDVSEDDTLIEGIGGVGCAVCATEELNTFILLKRIRHQDERENDTVDILNGVILDKNQLN